MPEYYDTRSGKYLTVSDEHRLPVITAIAESISLVDKSSAAGSATYAAETSKNVTLEFFGSSDTTTSTLSFQLKGPSGKGVPVEGIRQTAPKDIVTSGKLGETVSFSVPAGFTLVINYTKPSTGTLSIQGTVE